MTPDPLRHLVYTLLTVTTVAAVAGRVGNAELVFEPSIHRVAGDTSPDAPPRDWPTTRPNPMPTFSSNDRSRWCTVRALVDHGTFVIGHRDGDPSDPRNDRGIVFENGWQTVDKVKNPDTNDYYSSKPPLLTILAAGEYWLLKHAFGWTITGDPNKVVKAIVLTFNILPLVLYLLLLRRLLERLGTTEWGRLFVFAAACYGTFVTTFATTLNNHTPAAVAALAAIYPFVMTEGEERRLFGFIPLPALPSNGWLMVSAMCAGMTACLELPALAFLVALGGLVALRSWKCGLLFLAPALLLFSFEFFILNKITMNEWLPAYSKLGGPWYEYPGSHWLKPPPGEVKRGIDWARQHESIWAYIFHCLLGHHGLFSLTPIWLLSFAAMIRRTLFSFRIPKPGVPAFLHPFVLIVSLTVIGSYFITSSNYGGWTSGLRWLIWLTPLWLVTLLPAADRLGASRWGRGLCCALLAVSVFSASFPAWNPWRHPWLYRLMESQGWVRY